MFLKTNAIILNSIKYSENSVILHVYTQEYGRATYIVNGVKSKKSVIRPALFMPLSILELEVEHNPKKEIQRIKESKIVYPFSSIPFDPIKNSISFLLSEVLSKCLKETEKNPSLFEFVAQSIIFLDNNDKGIANFHLIFLIKLSNFLGFYPNMDNENESTYFDLLNGTFFAEKPLHSNYLAVSESNILKELLLKNFDDMYLLSYSRKQKNEMLEQLIKYYRLHLTEFGQIKSIEILQVLFD
jgi:DNA repair protein RecO (recombination protein O)